MHDEQRVAELVELALTTARMPQEVCASELHLLPEVERRWRRCRILEAELEGYFPQSLKPPANIEAKPPAIPGYEIDSVLGHGGMGVVYKARQIALGRTVALKMLLAGDFASGPQKARFLREAEAIAELSDASIVQIYDYGHCQGRPYYAMEYIDGQSLAEKLASGPLAAMEAAQYAFDIATAMQQAHAACIVHRDLKPANLLLTKSGKLKVTDFGLARQLNATLHLTLTGDHLGTPSYMAPEQAVGDLNRVGTAADVYSIGAVLYEMLTGRPPFQADTAAETQRQLLEHEPVRPSRLNAAVPFDLQTICMKCLEKTPERRYASAADLADDLRKMLAGQPISARPIGGLEQTYRWAKRNRLAASTLGAGLMLIAVLLVLSLTAASHFRRLAREKGELAEKMSSLVTETDKERAKAVAAEFNEQQLRKKSEALANEFRQSLYLTEMNLAARSVETPGDMTRMLERLAPWELKRPEIRQWEWGYLYGLLHQSERTLPAHARGVQQLQLSPAGNRLLTVGGDRCACIWSLDGSDHALRLIGHSAPARACIWSPAGERAATADQGGVVCMWNTESGALVRRWSASERPLLAIAWSPDAKWIATAGVDRVVRIWDSATGARRSELPGHDDQINALDWNSVDGRLASAGQDKKILVWNVDDSRQVAALEGHMGWINDVEWSRDGRRLASASSDRSAIIWDLEKLGPALRLEPRSLGVKSVAWSPDGSLLATGGDDQVARIWSAVEGTQHRTLVGHSREVNTIAWRDTIVTGAGDGEVRVWSSKPDVGSPQRVRHPAPLFCLRWSPVDPKSLAAGGATGSLLFCSGSETIVVAADSSPIQVVVWKPTGEMLATLSLDGTIRIWDTASRTVVRTVAGPSNVVRSIDWSPDGQFIAGGGTDGVTRIWKPGGEAPIKELRLSAGIVTGVAWNPIGSQLAVTSSSGYVTLYATQDWQEVRKLREQSSAATTLAWCPNGSKLAIGAHQYAVEVWRVADGERIAMLHGNRSHPAEIAWSPDGRRIATAGRDGSVRIFDADSSREVMVFNEQTHASHSIDWNRDGFALASCGNSGEIAIYDAWRGFYASKSSHLLPTLNERLASSKEADDLRSRGLVYARTQDQMRASDDLRAYLTQTGKPWIVADCYVAGPFSIDFDQTGASELQERCNSNPLVPPADIAWTRFPLSNYGFINFGRLFDGKGRVSGYSYLPIYCLYDCGATLRFGSDDQMCAWLNGQLIHEIQVSRTAEPGQDQVAVGFRQGWNCLLVRVANERNNHILYLEVDDVTKSNCVPPRGEPRETQRTRLGEN